MKMDRSTRVSIGVIVAAILGFIGFQFWLYKDTQKIEESVKSSKKQQITRAISQPTSHIKSKPSPSSSFTKRAKNNKEVDRMIDEFVGKIESLEITDLSQEEKSSENNQDITTESYDERYDTLVEICKQIGPLHEKIKNIQEDISYQFDLLKGDVADIYSPTEDEEIIIQEWREKCQPLCKEQKRFIGKYIVLFDKVDKVVPGSVKSEVSSDDNKSVNYIDYVYIKSTLGSAPEDIDFYLSDFFNKARLVNVIYQIELNNETENSVKVL